MWQTLNDSWSRPHLTTARYISHYATSCANPTILHNTHKTILPSTKKWNTVFPLFAPAWPRFKTKQILRLLIGQHSASIGILTCRAHPDGPYDLQSPRNGSERSDQEKGILGRARYAIKVKQIQKTVLPVFPKPKSNSCFQPLEKNTPKWKKKKYTERKKSDFYKSRKIQKTASVNFFSVSSAKTVAGWSEW